MYIDRESRLSLPRPDLISKPDQQEGIPQSNLVIITDVEGPLVLGDTYADLMAESVKPNPREFRGLDYRSEINYGVELFEATYQWFTKYRYNKGLGQDGSDIVLHLPTLLFFGQKDQDVIQQARRSRKSPGSEKLLDFLRSEKRAVIVGVTTAWHRPHQIALEPLGLDGIVGTEFSLDEAKETLMNSGKGQEEIKLVKRFLSRTFKVISDRHWAFGEEKEIFTKWLEEEIERFFTDVIGVTWDEEGYMVTSTPDRKFKTELGTLMASLRIMGDKEKARAAKVIAEKCSLPGATVVAIGDGLNDAVMLKETFWSIGINGAAAASAAAIGVATENVDVLQVVIDLITKYPEQTEENIRKVVAEAQEILGDRAVVHLGGRIEKMTQDLIDLQVKAKKKYRGKVASKTA